MVINAIYVMKYSDDKEVIENYCNKEIKIKCISSGNQVDDQLLKSANVIIGDIFKDEWHVKTPNLKYFLLPYAGLPQKLIPCLKKKKLVVSNLHYNSHIVAEHAFAMLLALVRNIIEIDKQTRDGKLLKEFSNMHFDTLLGKRLLIIGYGSLGRAVERIGAGFSMVMDKFTSDMNKKHLHQKLKQCDVACVCLPLTMKTIDFINKDALDCMRRNSIIVNIARGEIVKEEALYASLKKNQIRGACIDTWYGYANISEATKIFSYPFNDLTNVIMSPHVAFRSDNQQVLRVRAIHEYLVNLTKGNIVNQVELDKGY